jgi:hypothetical protein
MYKAKKYMDYRQGASFKPKKTPCPHSREYNEAHYARFKSNCKHSHEVFHWQGVTDNLVCLIGDSICKWSNEIQHLEIQAVPGLSLEGALDKMVSGKLNIHGFHGLFVHLGTNDVTSSKCDPDEIAKKMSAIIDYLEITIPDTRLGISMIIPRPRDNEATDEMRRKVNARFKKLCKDRGCTFLRSYKAVTTEKVYDKSLYAKDRLHLKLEGIKAMRRFLRGAAVTMIDDIPKARPQTIFWKDDSDDSDKPSVCAQQQDT